MKRFVVIAVDGDTIKYLSDEEFDTYDEGCAWANRHVSDSMLRIFVEESVDHPVHYNSGKVETIDKIQNICTPEEFVGFLKGNILKYKDRHKLKGGIRDLMKAKWYEDKLASLGVLK